MIIRLQRYKINPIIPKNNTKGLTLVVMLPIIADVAPSYRSEFGRLCLQCGSDNIRVWDMKTCPKCQGEMEDTGEKEFWT